MGTRMGKVQNLALLEEEVSEAMKRKGSKRMGVDGNEEEN